MITQLFVHMRRILGIGDEMTRFNEMSRLLDKKGSLSILEWVRRQDMYTLPSTPFTKTYVLAPTRWIRPSSSTTESGAAIFLT